MLSEPHFATDLYRKNAPETNQMLLHGSRATDRHSLCPTRLPKTAPEQSQFVYGAESTCWAAVLQIWCLPGRPALGPCCRASLAALPYSVPADQVYSETALQDYGSTSSCLASLPCSPSMQHEPAMTARAGTWARLQLPGVPALQHWRPAQVCQRGRGEGHQGL